MILVFLGITIAALIGAFAFYLLVVALVPGFSVPEQSLEKAKSPIRGNHTVRSGSRKEVSFDVEGIPLSAWLYMPEDLSSRVPCIVMAHGLGGTKDAGLEPYAVRFQKAGFAVLAFDYRHLGQSGGEPRQLVWIPFQLEDTSAAVDYVRGLAEINPARIALWGTSLSAGHAIVTAARNDEIACICGQCPFLHGSEAALRLFRIEGLGRMFRLIPHGQRDMVRSFLGLSPHKIPLVGRAGSIAVMADSDAWSTFEELAPAGFVNEVCARILIRIDKYRPVKKVAKMHCPVLLQITDHEISYQTKAVEEAKKRLGERLEVIHYPIGHFDIYLGSNFERSVSDQVAFFKKHLRAASVG